MPKPINPTHLQRVVLTGFMGSGKSTVGKLLARELGWEFIDLDDAVAAQRGMSVPEIFSRDGEASFRAAEVEALRGLLALPQRVVALGGGAPETNALRALLAAAADTAVIHLHAPFELLYNRCLTQARNPEATARPLLTEPEAARKRYTRRLTLYGTVAHHVVDAADSTQAVTAKILHQLQRMV